MGVRDECLGESRSALARYHRTVVFRLSDEERLTVRLAATLDGTTGKLPEVNTTLPIDPANGTTVADEHLEFGELHEARQ